MKGDSKYVVSTTRYTNLNAVQRSATFDSQNLERCTALCQVFSRMTCRRAAFVSVNVLLLLLLLLFEIAMCFINSKNYT